MALVTLLKHSHRVPALLSACLPLQPPLTWLGEGGSAPRLGAFAQERCQAFWGRQALSSTGVQLTWDTRCAQRCTSSRASGRAREQFCYCINFPQLTHLRN